MSATRLQTKAVDTAAFESDCETRSERSAPRETKRENTEAKTYDNYACPTCKEAILLDVCTECPKPICDVCDSPNTCAHCTLLICTNHASETACAAKIDEHICSRCRPEHARECAACSKKKVRRAPPVRKRKRTSTPTRKRGVKRALTAFNVFVSETARAMTETQPMVRGTLFCFIRLVKQLHARFHRSKRFKTRACSGVR